MCDGRHAHFATTYHSQVIPENILQYQKIIVLPVSVSGTDYVNMESGDVIVCVCLCCTCDEHTVRVGAAAVELRVQDSLSSDAVFSSFLQGGDKERHLFSSRHVDIRLMNGEGRKHSTTSQHVEKKRNILQETLRGLEKVEGNAQKET